jgi:hypothetical protein
MRTLALVLIVCLASCTPIQIDWPKYQRCDPRWVGNIYRNPQECLTTERADLHDQYTLLASCLTKWGKTVEGKPATPDNVINFIQNNGGDACRLGFRALGVQRYPKQKFARDYIERMMAEEQSCILLLSKEDGLWYLVNVADSNHYEGFNARGGKKVITLETFYSINVHDNYVRDFYDF